MSSTCTEREVKPPHEIALTASRRKAGSTRPAGPRGVPGLGGRDRARFRALQPRDERAEEYPIEAQLAGGRDLLEERRAHLEHRHRACGADGGGALGARHVARLAEAVAGVECAD